MNSILRQRLLATTLLVGASVVASPAFAQEQTPVPPETQSPPDNSATPTVPETTAPVEGTTTPSTSAEGENVESAQDIVVTGSRIPQPNLTSASPVTVVTSQEIKLQGTTRTEDLINSLPQSFAAQGSNISNGASGIATVNLRGLGSSRTLVLVNGRRLQPGDPRTPVPDINFIPSSLVKRVDVLTGGASSVYGADAVAGVVNFIMDTNFRGVRIDGQISTFSHNNDIGGDVEGAINARGFPLPRGWSTNGTARDISVAIGAGLDDNRGHVMAYATYRKQDAVLQSTRDYSACSISARNPTATNPSLVSCGGSATSSPATIFTNFDTLQIGPNRTLLPGFTPFNFAPYNYYQRPNERYTLGAFAEYEISEAAKPYLEAMFMNDQSVAQIAPSGIFFNLTNINCDNPLLSPSQLAVLCAPDNLVDNNGDGVPDVFIDQNGNPYNRGTAIIGRRNVEGGGRQDDLEHTAFRIVGGVRGDLLRGLSYDAYYQFGRTNLSQTYLNDFSVVRSARAIDVVTDPATGLPVCRSVLDGSDPNCVPYDIFTEGGVTPEALSYLQTPGQARGNIRETVANANFTVLGEEFGLKSPYAERGLGLNVGFEYRKEALDFTVDEAFRTGDLAGQGGPTLPVNGEFDVRDVFAELQVPLVENSFVDELTLSAGYRRSFYKVGDNDFSTDTYKLAVEFAPISDVRLRGSYNRAVRAPNVVELFSSQSVGLTGTNDPCAGATPEATLAQCQLTGVTAAQYGNIIANPANQYNGFIGGNPDLRPETADSYTAGVVLQPRFIPGLAITADYFNIKVKDLVGVIGFDTIVTQCITSGDPFFCDRINRDQFGSLFLTPNGFVTDINTNVGGLKTSGVDVNASYARRIGSLGNLNLSLVGTWLNELSTNPLADIRYDCTGFFGVQCGTPNPEWRHKFRVGFTLPNGLGLSTQWRYFSAVKNDALSKDEDLAGSSFEFNERIKAQSYFDLALQARVADKFNFRVGANNIFDKRPPIVGSQVLTGVFGNGNTFPQVYDALGRYLFAGFTVDF